MTHAATGNYAMALAAVASGGAALAAISAVKYDSPSLLRVARWSIHAVTGLFTVACVALLAAFLRDDFSLTYVVGYSERLLPIGYKISALWAGHQGSLLLWAWLMAGMASLAVTFARRDRIAHAAPAIGLLGMICGLFVLLLMFTSNPFELGKILPPDGQGMNPMLQDPGMIIHPPMLFLGYAAATIPFAFGLGVLIAGRSDRNWIGPLRNWMVASWLFLTVGIALGAWWAYVELGWGGYWAWDPVENASLLPWLAATAALHSLIAHQRRGMMKVWNALLAPVTFILCLFATWLTRSGAISSVHAYPESPVGMSFLIVLLACLLATAGVAIWRRDLLRGERPLERLISREGAFTAGNALLVVMILTIMIGTIFPLLSKPFTDKGVMLDQNFYNAVVLPMTVALAILMGFGPMLRPSSQKTRLRGRLILPAIALHAAAVGAGIWSGDRGGDRSANIWMAVCAGASTFIVVCILQDIVVSIWTRWRNRREGVLLAALRSLLVGRRRYGGYLAHVGMAMIVVSVAASSLHRTEKDEWLTPGDSIEVGGYTLRLDSLTEIREANYHARQAEIAIAVIDSVGEETVLTPELRQYYKSEKRNTEVDVHSNLLEDVYVILTGWKPGGEEAHIKVTVKPLVIWIWIGSITMSAGGLLCLLPSSRKHAGRAEEAEKAVGSAPVLQPAKDLVEAPL